MAPRPAGAVTRPTMTGALSALAVLFLHLLFGLGVALSPPVSGSSGAGRPLVLLTELPPVSMRPSAEATAVDLKVSVPLPRPSMPLLPASPGSGVIVDAAPADVDQVSRICSAWPMQRPRRDAPEREPSVLVRVDADGRVSDSRLLVGTGSADGDAALQHCLLTLARLTPVHLDDHAVAAWQRLQPQHAAASHRH